MVAGAGGPGICTVPECPLVGQMTNKTVSKALVGIAGVGVIALPTIRNTAGYDIIVATPDGERR